MKKILLIEDSESIAKGLQFSLEQEGYNVEITDSSKYAKEQILKEKYDLVILDISLPDGNGFEVCEYIKKNTDIPVIFLTARDEETNIVLGFDIGADDYVTKPFRTRELISRINNVLRRQKNQLNKRDNIIKVKNISVDLDKMLVLRNDKEITLTALEFRIVSLLFSNIGSVITREQILDRIWDVAGNFVNDNTLTVYIKRIREKLEENAQEPEIIKTIRGIGYKIEE